jgi:hypothetical protein
VVLEVIQDEARAGDERSRRADLGHGAEQTRRGGPIHLPTLEPGHQETLHERRRARASKDAPHPRIVEIASPTSLSSKK